MAEAKEKVFALVERELKRDPAVKSTALQQRAVKIDRSVGELSGRQFHAQYALPVRRKLFRGQRGQEGAGSVAERSAEALLTDSYQAKRAALAAAIDQAFDRAISTGRLEQVNKLFANLERHTKAFKSG